MLPGIEKKIEDHERENWFSWHGRDGK
jgi:hypothetical protein